MQRILQQDKYIRGVAQLNNNIYVLHNTFLAVYDAVSFERLEDIEVSLEEGRPADCQSIAACSVNQCLFIADRWPLDTASYTGSYTGDGIIRLEIKNGGKTVTWMNTTVNVMYNKKFVHLYSNIISTK